MSKPLKLTVDVLGIYRFRSIVQNPKITVEEYLGQLDAEFRKMYELSVSPSFDSISKYTATKDRLSRQQHLGHVLLCDDRIEASPDDAWVATLQTTPWQIIGISEQEFDIRIDLLKKIFGEECNASVLGSCLLRGSGNLSKAASFCSYIRPDALGSSKKILFVRPREDTHRQVERAIGSNEVAETKRKLKL